MYFINYATLNKINNKTSVTGKYHVPIIKRSDIRCLDEGALLYFEKFLNIHCT